MKVEETVLLVATAERVLTILLRGRRLLNKLKALRGHDLDEFGQSVTSALWTDIEEASLGLEKPHNNLLEHRYNTGLVNAIRAHNVVHLLLWPSRFIVPINRRSRYTLTPIVWRIHTVLIQIDVIMCILYSERVQICDQN
jgi:hypothetical protein